MTDVFRRYLRAGGVGSACGVQKYASLAFLPALGLDENRSVTVALTPDRDVGAFTCDVDRCLDAEGADAQWRQLSLRRDSTLERRVGERRSQRRVNLHYETPLAR